MLAYLIALAIGGLITGGLARLALPGPDPMSLLQTMFVGIGGFFIAGLIYYVATDGQARGVGYLAGFTCSVVIVYIIRRRRGGDLTHPGRDPRRRR
ncbi:hypothetical protein OM076_32910 [Solirubrobacter ginsenosidimutans]|uniref:GlsB/YeaQ/YmgE family stress response membrane protein n=1 Tax=Solirubrobacter ginsenosidimutans TaxID=490573 RepID=A0A9X3N0L1_9ACTN|nr:hypothetical protein [Solirubrobacter ginsenosidimutans]MDA0165116.1 hypothetical protein [Solirubrobacter ginsenosidimutans]